MRRKLLTLALVGAAALAVFWALGGLDAVRIQLADGQRAFQNALAGALRALHGGEAGALATLWGVAFAYGFLHAAGPGHGKFLLGAYGAGTKVPLARMAGIGLAASLGQAGAAVALVYGGVAIFALSRAQIEAVSDEWLAPLSLIAIAALGLWLVWRGARALGRLSGVPTVALAAVGVGASRGPRHHHQPYHHHDQRHAHMPCADCGHHHLPDAGAVAQIGSPRDAVLLVGAIALRPCTGALFLLILTWRMGLEWQGVSAALAMGLGTASVTVAVGALAVVARDSALKWSGRISRLAAFAPGAELLVGALVAGVAVMLLLQGGFAR